nr:MAG TPA: hypothetical protein [Caudoviricetes sp.]
MKTIALNAVTAEEFRCLDNPLAASIYAHYAHTAMSLTSLTNIYNNLLLEQGINPMHSVEQHLPELEEAECAYGYCDHWDH